MKPFKHSITLITLFTPLLFWETACAIIATDKKIVNEHIKLYDYYFCQEIAIVRLSHSPFKLDIVDC